MRREEIYGERMILKELEEKETNNKYEEYGYKAERQLAFYLKRAFENDKSINVINNLCLELNGDVAQIDHLIIHEYGFIIIESKSVTSKILINERGEWIRQHRGSSQGMPSPVNQARRQADFLRKYLMPKSELLLKKFLGVQHTFEKIPIDIIVAISDNGIIDRAKNIDLPEVCKADQVTDFGKDIIGKYKKQDSKYFSLSVPRSFSEVSFYRVSNYLLRSHSATHSINSEVVRESNISQSKIIPDKEIPKNKIFTKPICKNKCIKCGSSKVNILYGKYGYYFKCLNCSGNSAIKLKCVNSKCKVRLRKEKERFFQECKTCNTSILYHMNTNE